MIPDISIIKALFELKTYLLDPHAYTCIPTALKFTPFPNLLSFIADHPAANDPRRQIRTQFRAVISTNQIPTGSVLLNTGIFLVFNSAVCQGRDEFELLFSGFGVKEPFEDLEISSCYEGITDLFGLFSPFWPNF